LSGTDLKGYFINNAVFPRYNKTSYMFPNACIIHTDTDTKNFKTFSYPMQEPVFLNCMQVLFSDMCPMEYHLEKISLKECDWTNVCP
jgi:hypothetical protein